MANHRMTYRVVFIAIALLAVPYLVDVAFYGDFTPTHYAQETSLDEPLQDSDIRDGTLVPHHVNVVFSDADSLTQRPASAHSDSLLRAIFPSEFLISASLLSIPPPIPHSI